MTRYTLDPYELSISQTEENFHTHIELTSEKHQCPGQ